MEVSRLRCAPLDTTRGGRRGRSPRKHVVSTRDPPPAGRRGETPTETASPTVSGRFVEVSRLRCASLDTTSGRAGEADPPENTSSRPETRPRRGDVERPPRSQQFRSCPADSWRCLDSAALRSTRPGVGGGGGSPRKHVVSTAVPTPVGTEWRDPHGGSVPDCVRLIHGDVSTSLRSARHDPHQRREIFSAESHPEDSPLRSTPVCPEKTRPSGLEEHGVSEGAKAGAPEIIGGIWHCRAPLTHSPEHPQGPFDDFSGDRRLLSRVLHSLDLFAPFVSRQKGHPYREEELSSYEESHEIKPEKDRARTRNPIRPARGGVSTALRSARHDQ